MRIPAHTYEGFINIKTVYCTDINTTLVNQGDLYTVLPSTKKHDYTSLKITDFPSPSKFFFSKNFFLFDKKYEVFRYKGQ